MGFLDLVDDFQQVLPILILEHRLRELAHTLFRNTDKEATAVSGFEVLMDTNNSTKDFYEREKQSLHE